MEIKYNEVTDGHLGINWGDVKESIELRNIDIILDFDKNYKVVGLEILDFLDIVKQQTEGETSELKQKFSKDKELESNSEVEE